MGKVALITGASQGIGAAIAIKFATEGYDVAINCFNENEMNTNGVKVQAECEALGVKACLFPCDVSKFDAVSGMVKSIKEEMGSIDVLVNNAGITKDGLLARMSEEQFDAVTNVNYKGVFNVTRHVSGVMIKQKYGRIVNISSVAGVYGNAGQFNYSAAKAGLIGMTMTAAKELGSRNITVNAVAPGFIDTAMTEVLSDDIKKAAINSISLRRFGKVSEIADTVYFLASDAAGFITGQTIVVDGGMIM